MTAPLVTINGVRGYFISSTPEVCDYRFILDRIAGKSFALVDKPLTPNIIALIKALVAAGGIFAACFDHHDGFLLDDDARARIDWVKTQLNGSAFIFDRVERGTCVELVPHRYFLAHNISEVIVDPDFDGLAAYWRGCGIGFRGMIDCAACVELSPYRRVTRLNHIGKFIFQAQALFHRTEYANNSRDIFQLLTDFVSGGCKFGDPKNQRLIQMVDQVIARRQFQSCLVFNRTEHLTGDRIVIADLRNHPRIDLGHWKRLVYQSYGSTLFAYIALNTRPRDGSARVVVEIPAQWRSVKGLDLRVFLPDGTHGHVPYKVAVPFVRWDEFLVKWRMRKIALPKNK